MVWRYEGAMFNQIFRLNSYERKLAYLSTVPLPVRTILAGTSRSLRDEWDNSSSVGSLNRAISANVLSPLLFSYACWILESAQKDRRSRLYFMARDGLAVKNVVDVLIDNWSLPIETHYLYCSRESLMLPAYRSTGVFEFDWITWGYLNSVTLEEVCCRLQIKLEELSPYFDLDLRLVKSDAALSVKALAALRKVLCLSAVESLIEKKARELAEIAGKYFIQEGLDSSDSWAIVDTGWRARSQYALSSILEYMSIRPDDGVHGYYLGLNTSCCKYQNDDLKSFLFDWRSTPVDYSLNNFLCFELLFAANHARTIGYRETESGVVPVFAEPPSEDEIEISTRQHAISVEYARRVTSQVTHGKIKSGDLRTVVRRIMAQFIGYPSFQIADEYGRALIASEMRERDMQEMAPEMTYSKFFKSALGIEKIEGFWPQASMRRGGMVVALCAYNIFLKLRLLDWYRRVILKY